MEFVKSILRLVQFLWVLLATALIGNVVATNGGDVANATLNFIMFVCALAWVAMLYGIIAHFAAALGIPIVSLALDGFTTLFTFIGSVVLSAKLGVVNCGGNLVSRTPFHYLHISHFLGNPCLTPLSQLL